MYHPVDVYPRPSLAKDDTTGRRRTSKFIDSRLWSLEGGLAYDEKSGTILPEKLTLLSTSAEVEIQILDISATRSIWPISRVGVGRIVNILASTRIRGDLQEPGIADEWITIDVAQVVVKLLLARGLRLLGVLDLVDVALGDGVGGHAQLDRDATAAVDDGLKAGLVGAAVGGDPDHGVRVRGRVGAVLITGDTGVSADGGVGVDGEAALVDDMGEGASADLTLGCGGGGRAVSPRGVSAGHGVGDVGANDELVRRSGDGLVEAGPVVAVPAARLVLARVEAGAVRGREVVASLGDRHS
jgi:hypothetical protein